MTCLVSYIDDSSNNNSDKKIWMGGDTCVSMNSGTKRTISSPKIMKLKDVEGEHEYLLGVCGDPRCIDLLRYSLEIPRRLPGDSEDIKRFIHTKFVGEIIDCMKRGLYSTNINNAEEMGSYILICTDTGDTFCIESNYQVITTTDMYYAAGSGAKIALGSLFTTKDMQGLDAGEKVILAIEAAAEYETTVALPMDIESIDIIN